MVVNMVTILSSFITVLLKNSQAASRSDFCFRSQRTNDEVFPSGQRSRIFEGRGRGSGQLREGVGCMGLFLLSHAGTLSSELAKLVTEKRSV